MTFLFRWLCVLAILCVSSSLSAEETDRELIAKIDASIDRAVKFLASKQSADGAWRSDVYAPFKEGDALTPLVMTALLPLPIDDATEPVCERGIKYLAEISKRTFEKEDRLKSLAYPVYTAANITIALHQHRRAQDEAIRAKWVQTLRDLQLTEATGWKPEDVEYGGWTYGNSAAKKPAEGQVLGTLDHPNMSATAFALRALAIAAERTDSPTMRSGLHFVQGLQNRWERPGTEDPEFHRHKDDGFFFVHSDPVRNKSGGNKARADQIYHGFYSYGSATADGLRAMKSCGSEAKEDYQLGMRWLESNYKRGQHSGMFRDREAARNGLFFYFVSAFSQALADAKQPRFSQLRPTKGERKWYPATVIINWPDEISQDLIHRQMEDGSWRNETVDQREDDPLIATSFAIQALTACRELLVEAERPKLSQQADGSISCTARDATCRGEKLQYEPQPHKNTIGYWVNEQDCAKWNINVAKPGTFEVVVWQGCGAGQGGSEVAIGVGDNQVKFVVEETGHFQHFERRTVGRLTLAAGEQELTLKALKKAKGAVADVRQISLIPVASAE